ncbi:MAG TPA: phosphoribosylanthranilate isomerase [Actinobacteria bacterium]|nr:phosphoribosylanthranilate isomerase [Actinomycetota bacterium]
MTWVKVCGITCEEDLEVAEAAGADAVGLVVAPSSPRAVAVDRARRLARRTSLATVLVTVDLDPGELLSLAATTGVTHVQPHGAGRVEAAAAALAEGLEVLFPVGVGAAVEATVPPAGATVLYDRASPRHGGTGTGFDWSLVVDAPGPYVLAGGLGPDNVAEAVARLDPWGVDASSRLEVAPGRKDPRKVVEFVRRAKGEG